MNSSGAVGYRRVPAAHFIFTEVHASVGKSIAGCGCLEDAAQDFVDKYNIRTVFGIGGGYVQEAAFIVLIVFAREQIDEERAHCFLPLATAIKAATTGLLLRNKIFNTAVK